MTKIAWNKFITDFESSKSLDNVINRSLKPNYHFSKNILASEITTMGTGGDVALLFETGDIEILKVLLACCAKNQILFKFIGNGSNVVICDEGIHTQLIIKFTSREKPIELNSVLFSSRDNSSFPQKSNSNCKFFRISASHSMIGLSRLFSAEGLSGFEFAAGIPGTVGGALRMNAGAHGNTFSEIVQSAQVMTNNGVLESFDKDTLKFEYRQVNIPPGYLILSVDIVLLQKEISSVVKKRKDALDYRKKTQPLKQPSSGSVFKNPSPDLAAGYLLETVGLKGFRFGGIEFSDLHANWLVKVDDSARSSDVKHLVELGKQKVFAAHGIKLEEEIIFWDES